MKIKWLAMIIAIIFFGILYLSNIGTDIPVNSNPLKILVTPDIRSHKGVKVYRLETGYAVTLEGFVFSGGSLFKTRNAVHNAALITHPHGNILIDTGIGRDIDKQFEDMPWWAKPLFDYHKIEPARAILDRNKIKIAQIIPTHLHWDHASGFKEFPEAAILTDITEYKTAHAEEARPPAYLKSQYTGKNIHWQMIAYDSGAYEIFPESHDVYRDGSIVIVKLEGHSPGSVGIFVNVSEKERYFFVGDLVWAIEALKKPAHKFFISSFLADGNKEQTGKQIVEIHKFMKLHPELIIIPAHDGEAYKSIPVTGASL